VELLGQRPPGAGEVREYDGTRHLREALHDPKHLRTEEPAELPVDAGDAEATGVRRPAEKDKEQQ
jgi:hypothetical protein